MISHWSGFQLPGEGEAALSARAVMEKRVWSSVPEDVCVCVCIHKYVPSLIPRLWQLTPTRVIEKLWVQISRESLGMMLVCTSVGVFVCVCTRTLVRVGEAKDMVVSEDDS